MTSACQSPHSFLIATAIFEMAMNSAQQKGRKGVFSKLDAAIVALNLAKELSSITPAGAVFGSASALLTMIKVRFLLRRRASGQPSARNPRSMNGITSNLG